MPVNTPKTEVGFVSTIHWGGRSSRPTDQPTRVCASSRRSCEYHRQIVLFVVRFGPVAQPQAKHRGRFAHCFSLSLSLSLCLSLPLSPTSTPRTPRSSVAATSTASRTTPAGATCQSAGGEGRVAIGPVETQQAKRDTSPPTTRPPSRRAHTTTAVCAVLWRHCRTAASREPARARAKPGCLPSTTEPPLRSGRASSRPAAAPEGRGERGGSSA